MRTTWYLVAVLVSVMLAIAAVWLARRLTARLGGWNAGVVAAEAYVVVVAVVYVLLPDVAETPQPLRDAAGVIIYPGFPADVLYEFRLVSLGTQLVLWVAIGLLFGRLAGRLLGKRRRNRTGIGHRGVTGVVRLTLVSHAMTDAMAAATVSCRRAAQRQRLSASGGGLRNQKRYTPTHRTRAAGSANRAAVGSAAGHGAAVGRSGLRTVAWERAAEYPAR